MQIEIEYESEMVLRDGFKVTFSLAIRKCSFNSNPSNDSMKNSTLFIIKAYDDTTPLRVVNYGCLHMSG